MKKITTFSYVWRVGGTGVALPLLLCMEATYSLQLSRPKRKPNVTPWL